MKWIVSSGSIVFILVHLREINIVAIERPCTINAQGLFCINIYKSRKRVDICNSLQVPALLFIFQVEILLDCVRILV